MSGERLVDPASQRCARQRTDLTPYLGAADEEQHGWDALHSQPGRHRRRLVDVDLDDPQLAGPLGRQQMRNLRIFAGTEHPHEGQSPEVIDVASMNRKNKVGA